MKRENSTIKLHYIVSILNFPSTVPWSLTPGTLNCYKQL